MNHELPDVQAGFKKGRGIRDQIANICWIIKKARVPEKSKEKKAFLSEQRKEIEENNRMGKTRDLFKTIRDTKGTFHAKMDTIKDRNGMDLTETEDIKKRWQE